MAKEMDLVAKVGSWAFIFGVVVALVVGVLGKGDLSVATTVLIILGLIVGLLNVTGRETTPFLLASVSLVIVSSMGGNVFPGYGLFMILKQTLNAVITFVMPATIIVALKAIYALAHDE
jgi:hypothetical protein